MNYVQLFFFFYYPMEMLSVGPLRRKHLVHIVVNTGDV